MLHTYTLTDRALCEYANKRSIEFEAASLKFTFC